MSATPAAELVRCLQADAEQLLLLDSQRRLNDAERDAAIRLAVSLAWYLARAKGWTLTTEHSGDGMTVVLK